jgi:predicted ATPase/DNA-binding SARP family transcriptional activator
MPFRAPSRSMSLLAYLALNRARPVPRDAVAFALWPDIPEADARTKLRTHLHLLLAGGLPPAEDGMAWIIADKRALEWNAASKYLLDVAEFERLAQQPSQARAAIKLYTGDLLEGFDDEWIEPIRSRLRQRQLALLCALIENASGQGEYQRSIEYADMLLALDPWREDAVRALMTARHGSGDRAGAIQVYRDFSERLKEELGVEPTSETTRVYEQVASIEAGPRRVAAPPAHHLPAQLTSFIGRETELAEADRLFAQTRLLTMVGAGGVGKTRLAIQFASIIADRFPDGIRFVDFASLTDPMFVASTVLTAVGLREELGRQALDTLISHFRTKSAFIVLDNCEHVVDEVAVLAERLLLECENLRLLVTSRELLEIAGEVVHRIPTFKEEESIRLFASRASAAVPSFTPTPENVAAIKQICNRLDGIPLAIELAAVRVKMMTIEELRKRLDDRFRVLTGGSRTALARQRTLRGMIGWSYNLLSEQEKVLLRRLATFTADFSLNTATAVCAFDPVGEEEALELLSRLIDKSLVQSEPSGAQQRYRLLESTREFCLEHLDDAGEWTEVRRRQAQHVLSLAEAAEARAGTPSFDEFRSQAARDYADYRAVLQWALSERNDVALGAALAGALGRFWMERGQWREGRFWLEYVVAQEDEAIQPDTLALALLGLAGQYYVEGDFALMEATARRALEAYATMGNVEGQARARHHMAIGATFAGRFDEAHALYHANLGAARQIASARLEAVTLQNLAELLTIWKADYAQSERLYERAVAIHRDRGDSRSLSTALGDWSQTAADQGAYERSERLARESLAICREVGDETRIIEQLIRLGLYAAWAGDFEAARSPLREAFDQLRASAHTLYLFRFADACAFAALGSGQRLLATTLFAFAETCMRTKNFVRSTPEQTRCDDAIVAARAAIGDTEFSLAWEKGRGLSSAGALDAIAPLLGCDIEPAMAS